MQRRHFLKRGLAGGLLTLGALAGWLSPARLLAAWPKQAFSAEQVSGALQGLFGSSNVADSDKIAIKLPEVAENGAVVPITIETSLPDVTRIAVIVEKNPNPLAASFDLTPAARGFISTRIKMAETSPVQAIVESGGKLHRAVQTVKVTIGGCGG